MGLFDIITDAASSLLGGGQTVSSSGSGYASFIDGLFSSSQSASRKEAKARDEGIFNLGSNNERQPAGTTFKAYGGIHRNETEALQYLDDTTCYSGTLRCPVCGEPKNSPSEVELCRKQHRRDGYRC